MRTLEYLNILLRHFETDLKMDVWETESEWGTTHYEFGIWLDSVIRKNIMTEDRPAKRLREYLLDGYVAVLDVEGGASSESFDEAVTDFFQYCYDNSLLD